MKNNKSKIIYKVFFTFVVMYFVVKFSNNFTMKLINKSDWLFNQLEYDSIIILSVILGTILILLLNWLLNQK